LKFYGNDITQNNDMNVAEFEMIFKAFFKNAGKSIDI